MATLRVPITIPEGLAFEALRLTRCADGAVAFDWAAIEQVCAASKRDPALFRAEAEDNVAGLIVAWYELHRAHGGAPHPVAEEILAEMRQEDVALLRRAQQISGLSWDKFARDLLARDERTVRRWRLSGIGMPNAVVDWLQRYVDQHDP